MRPNRKQTSAQIHGTSALLGAALVLLGFAIGKLSTAADTDPNAAIAQEYTSVNTSFFRSGAPGLMTQSADGRTIHFWGLQNRQEQLDARNMPRFAGQVSAPEDDQ